MNRMVVAVLSLIGIFVSFYLMAHSFGWTGPLVCGGVGDCGAVQASPYSKWGPVPVSAVGFVGYVVLLAASIFGIQPGRHDSRLVALALLAGGTFGFGASLWFTYVEAFLIHAWCVWCVASAIVMTFIFLFALPEAKRLRGTP